MEVSNPDKLIFPADGLTKADLVGHYERVGTAMLRFLGGRPLTLQRYPSGIERKGFMQKNAAKHFPPSIERYPVPKRDGSMTNYAVVNHAEDIAYLANQGTVAFHMWTSTTTNPDAPDWLILDLDPEQDDVAGARAAVTATAEVLAEFGLAGFPLATGSKGFHIWVPLDGSVPFNEAAHASRAVAGMVAERHPDAFTTEFLKKNRNGRVFIDWLRTTRTATVVVPFSLRPRPGAPMAAPLRWSEVDSIVPNEFGLRNLADRLDVLEDELERHTLPHEEIVAAARATGVDLDTPHDRFGRT